MTYIISLTLTKISIVLQYFRFFANPIVRGACWATIIVVACYGIAAVVTTAFICQPLDAFWDSKVEAHYINTEAFYVAQSVLNIITDFTILMIPLPLLWTLKLTPKKRMQVGLMFAVGAL
jgi:hypothetical protein